MQIGELGGNGYFNVKTSTPPTTPPTTPPPPHGRKMKMKMEMERERGGSDVEWRSE